MGDLSLVLEAQRMHSGSVGVCLSCLGQMDAGKSFLLGMWGFVWVDGLVSFLLEVVLGRMKYKKKLLGEKQPGEKKDRKRKTNWG